MTIEIRASVGVRAISLIGLMMFSSITVGMETAELVIEAGTTFTVSKSQTELVLKRFVVGDNAVIKFASDVTHWHLEASDVHIGNNVVIDAAGAVGEAGVVGSSTLAMAADCSEGQSGQDAGHGGDGADAVSISMYLVINSVGSLSINSNGGNGGVGGPGGVGQQAGKIIRCSGPAGGDGGKGGNGGNGGNGGDVRIIYRYQPGASSHSALARSVSVKNAGGAAGDGVNGGAGGAGAKGKYVNKRTITGNKKWMAAGEVGTQGQRGERGRAGVAGQILLERDLDGRDVSMAYTPVLSQGGAAVAATTLIKGVAKGVVKGSAKPAALTEVAVLQGKVEVLQATIKTMQAAQKQSLKDNAKWQQTVKGLIRRIKKLESGPRKKKFRK